MDEATSYNHVMEKGKKTTIQVKLNREIIFFIPKLFVPFPRLPWLLAELVPIHRYCVFVCYFLRSKASFFLQLNVAPHTS